MKVRVTLQDLNGQNRPEHDFWTALPELPQVGDLIVQYQREDNEEANKQWYPDLQEFGASEFFKVVQRGWAYFTDAWDGGTVVNPFIVVSNIQTRTSKTPEL